ncbi:hypothetical protein ABTH20_21220, partial [Acinetobacter baumannii]
NGELNLEARLAPTPRPTGVRKEYLLDSWVDTAHNAVVNEARETALKAHSQIQKWMQGRLAPDVRERAVEYAEVVRQQESQR